MANHVKKLFTFIVSIIKLCILKIKEHIHKEEKSAKLSMEEEADFDFGDNLINGGIPPYPSNKRKWTA